MLRAMSQGPAVGSILALTLGVGLLAGAAYLAVAGDETLVAVILALIGASALSGWSRARDKRA